MLVELSIIPLGQGTHLSDHIAEVIKVIEKSGLPFQLTPSGTCIEGDWDQVMPLVRQCHDRMRASSSHVMTTIRIEDDANEQDKLHRNVTSIEEKIGHSLQQTGNGHHIFEARR